MKRFTIITLLVMCASGFCSCAAQTEQDSQIGLTDQEPETVLNQTEPTTTTGATSTKITTTQPTTKHTTTIPTTTVPTTEKETNQCYASWEDAYRVKIQEFRDSKGLGDSEAGMDIVDLNKDDIPELILSDYGYSIYTFYDWQVKELDTVGTWQGYTDLFTSPDYDVFMMNHFLGDAETWTWYRIEHGEAKQVQQTAYHVYGGEENQEEHYFVDEQEVSKSDFDTAMSRYGAMGTSYSQCGKRYAVTDQLPFE